MKTNQPPESIEMTPEQATALQAMRTRFRIGQVCTEICGKAIMVERLAEDGSTLFWVGIEPDGYAHT
jgi:hypothetical protein